MVNTRRSTHSSNVETTPHKGGSAKEEQEQQQQEGRGGDDEHEGTKLSCTTKKKRTSSSTRPRRQQHQQLKDELRNKNRGLGLKIEISTTEEERKCTPSKLTFATAPTQNKKVVFNDKDDEFKSSPPQKERNESRCLKKNEEEEDDAVEEVKGSAARDFAIEHEVVVGAAIRNSSVATKNKRKRKERPQRKKKDDNGGGESKNTKKTTVGDCDDDDEEEEMDDEFFEQLNVAREVQDEERRRKEGEMLFSHRRHTKFIMEEDINNDIDGRRKVDSAPIAIDDTIQIVVLSNSNNDNGRRSTITAGGRNDYNQDGTGDDSEDENDQDGGFDSFAVPASEISGESGFHSWNRLRGDVDHDDHRVNHHFSSNIKPGRRTSKPTKGGSTWKRSSKMKCIALSRRRFAGGGGNSIKSIRDAKSNHRR